MLTSFVKISVVLSILRNALGTQQIPPTQVITGISLILTFFIMAPVAERMYAEANIQDANPLASGASINSLMDAFKRGREPLRVFLVKHSNKHDQKLFNDLAREMARRNGNDPEAVGGTDFRVIIPSFVTSQLTEAFKIGFLLFLPFLVIDMVVANILQAMGMFMLSPMMISLPFKLLLFVLVDGWVLLIQGLVLSYN
jgi:type III secretion protein R